MESVRTTVLVATLFPDLVNCLNVTDITLEVMVNIQELTLRLLVVVIDMSLPTWTLTPSKLSVSCNGQKHTEETNGYSVLACMTGQFRQSK